MTRPLRLLADLLDPGRLHEIRELRDTAVRATQDRAVDAVDHALTVACWRAICKDQRAQIVDLRADVERLLEQAAACAHEHQDER